MVCIQRGVDSDKWKSSLFEMDCGATEYFVHDSIIVRYKRAIYCRNRLWGLFDFILFLFYFYFCLLYVKTIL